MFQPYSRIVALLALLSFGGVSVWGQAQPPQKKVKDQQEYDLFNSVTKETDANKKIQLLTTWKEKYPDSDFKMERLQFMIITYQQLRQGDKMLDTAQEMVKLEPNNVTGLYWITVLTISLANTAPERLDLGEKAAKGLIGQLDDTFAAAKRPQGTGEDAWKKSRNDMEALARKTLGWIQMSRKNHAEAEQEFTKSLELNPNSGQISYWLGSVIAAQRDPKKQVSALYHFARAAHYSGEDALPDPSRKQVQAYLEKVYISYTGRKDGLAELVESARKSATPPADLAIESEQERIVREENKLREENPQLALWLGVKKLLIGPEGSQYFDGQMKGTALPKLKGKVVSQTPATRPNQITLALSSDDTPEIVLKLDAPMTNPAEPGTEIEFENSVAAAFTTDPFLLMLDVEKQNVTGWPPPPKKVTPAKRRAPAKGAKK